MGVEPTTARKRPVTGFEDRGAHRNSSTPNAQAYQIHSGMASHFIEDNVILSSIRLSTTINQINS
jgi:hypothetical protein